MKTVISCDPGSETSGLVVIRNTEIVFADQKIPNHAVLGKITHFFEQFGGVVVIEDIAPYSQTLKMQVIQVCKFIGQLEYRLSVLDIGYEMIPRSSVKKWVYDEYQDVIWEQLRKKVIRSEKRRKDGKTLTPTFVWVDDRMVASAMRAHWGIKKPKPGHKNELGISGHSWQALGLATYWIKTGGRQDRPVV